MTETEFSLSIWTISKVKTSKWKCSTKIYHSNLDCKPYPSVPNLACIGCKCTAAIMIWTLKFWSGAVAQPWVAGKQNVIYMIYMDPCRSDQISFTIYAYSYFIIFKNLWLRKKYSLGLLEESILGFLCKFHTICPYGAYANQYFAKINRLQQQKNRPYCTKTLRAPACSSKLWLSIIPWSFVEISVNFEAIHIFWARPAIFAELKVQSYSHLWTHQNLKHRDMR